MMDSNPKHYFFYKFLVLLMLVGLGLLAITGFSVLVLKLSGIQAENSDILHGFIQQKPTLAKGIVFFQHIILFILTPLVFLMIFYKGKMLSFLDVRIPGFFEILLFAGLLLCVYPVMSVLTIWISQIDFPTWMNQLDDNQFKTMQSLLKMDNIYDLMINLTIVAIVPGIGEELMFRGIIQKELMGKWKNPHIAIWVTAFLFAAIHFQVVGLVAKLLIGLVLGYAYYFTKSIFVPILLHIINNASATVALYISGDVEWDNLPANDFSWSQLVLFIIFVGITFVFYTYIHQYYKKQEHG